MRSLPIVILALCVGLLFGTAGHGTEPALIDQLDPLTGWIVWGLLGLGLLSVVGLASYHTTAYWIAGDPKPSQIYFVDERTGEGRRADQPPATSRSEEGYTGQTERL